MNLSLRHYYRRWLKNLLLFFIATAIFLTLCRVGFALHFGHFQNLVSDKKNLLHALFLGLRFDLIPLAYIYSLPFLLLHILYAIPGRLNVKFVRMSLVSVLCMGYFILLWLYVFDYAFYSYFQDHLNILFFGLYEDDTVATLISVWKSYNLPVWLTVVLVIHYVIYRFIKIVFSMYDFDIRAPRMRFRYPIVLVVGSVVFAFFARGNFGRIPLSFEDAHISSDEFINELSLNGVITLNRAIKIRKTFGRSEFDYLKQNGFKDWQAAYSATFGKNPSGIDLKESLIVKSPENIHAKAHPPHTVLVVMESFGSYWDDRQSSEFDILGELKKHFDEGLLFKNFLSSENGTIGSIVSVATSSVIRPGSRFLSESEFMNLPLDSSGHMPYKNAGYETHFVYGGKLGWRELGKYLKKQKYDHLWGADEIKEAMPELRNISARELGNEWGIFDEYLYTFIEDHLRTAVKPQFFLVLTTSNHPPFEYPSSYVPKPINLTTEIMSNMTVGKDLALKRFNSLQYANQKVGEFITRIRSSTHKDNMIISLTGDHSFWIANGVGNEQEFKRYSVPFFISTPNAYKPVKVNLEKFGSHEDIFPSLYHLSLSNQKYVKLGEDLFSDESHALNSSGLVATELGAYHNGSYWKWKDRKKQILEQTAETPELLKLKMHSLGLISITDLYLKGEKTRMKTDEENGRP